MAIQQNLTSEQQRQVVVERVWLHYYNNTPPGKGDHHRNPAPTDEGADQQAESVLFPIERNDENRGGSHAEPPRLAFI